jgi:DNA replication and repair protein RecF
MELTSITLSSVRTYEKSTFHFSPHVTVIVGDNAIGKTNIIESIWYMATGKAFRGDSDRDLIMWDKDVAHLKAEVVVHGQKEMLETVITNGTMHGIKTPMKRFFVNKVPKRGIDFAGKFKAVLFWPNDLELVIDSPSIRRKYLDHVLSQVDREYRRNLISYERGLRQRNKVLQDIFDGRAKRSHLFFWNQLLINAGTYITEKRMEYLTFINDSEFYSVTYKTLYDKSIISVERLEQYKDEEVSARVTLVGPHRDDFSVRKVIETGQKAVSNKQITNNDQFINSSIHRFDDASMDVSRFGSRGEQRLAVLWLKLAELSFIEEKSGERPILLLDDIFSELDDESRAIVFSVLPKQQSIITSADDSVLTLIKNHVAKKDVSVIRLPDDGGSFSRVAGSG